MKIIKPSVEFYGAVPTDYEGALRFIEMAGRTCYRSEDKITPDSSEAIVRKLIKSGRLAMVEHSNLVIKKPFDIYSPPDYPTEFKYLNVLLAGGFVYIGGNLTAWYYLGQHLEWDAEFVQPFNEMYGELFGLKVDEDSYSQWEICPHNEIPKELHRYSAKFTCDRGVSHELVRHRPCSFAQESTRYVNYAGKDMEFIEPDGFEEWNYAESIMFEDICERSEQAYAVMLNYKLKPQQARAVLPNALKTEIVVTCDRVEWAHIFKLRCAPSAHPDFRRLAIPLRDRFQEEGLL
jgi:thymidylate synthase (FAD)